MNAEQITRSKDSFSTYCPEDDKLRLYVGRVPRDEYEALRKEGWTSTPKQAETSGCNFAAVWTPERENTALIYGGGTIEDEDTDPQTRAADRAERFAGYRDKRMDEATGKADAFDSRPTLHGYQSAALAERRAKAHDRLGDGAVTLWNKAEYWQTRTAGVIRNALHKAAPGVRMGRIKTLEAEKRRLEAQYTPESADRYQQDGEEVCICGQGRDRHAVKTANLEKIKAHYARTVEHLTLRLAYENQMLEAQGGRAASVDMIPGGWIGKSQIMKVNKSPTTGRVVSVAVKVPAVTGWAYKIQNVPGTDYALMTIDTERLGKEVYRAPTDEELAIFADSKKADKKAKAAATPKTPPLINPTQEEAEKLMDVWRAHGDLYDKNAEIIKMTQEQYSNFQGYHKPETVEVSGGGKLRRVSYVSQTYQYPAQARVRKGSGGAIIILTDKPQKPMPTGFWTDPKFADIEKIKKSFPVLQLALRRAWPSDMGEDEKELFTLAVRAGVAYYTSESQRGLTQTGEAIRKELEA